jgi:hypothetical protein
LKKDILLHLKQDQTAYCSTMLDFYALGEGFPGTPIPAHLPSIAKVKNIEHAIKADICALIPSFRPDVRLLPYIQLHEYEGLLFSHPAAFAKAINQPHLAARFQEIRDKFETPEDIDDDPETAPSKCVLSAYPRYRKVLEGTLAAGAVDIRSMRQACPHFRDWIERLEGLEDG